MEQDKNIPTHMEGSGELLPPLEAMEVNEGETNILGDEQTTSEIPKIHQMDEGEISNSGHHLKVEQNKTMDAVEEKNNNTLNLKGKLPVEISQRKMLEVKLMTKSPLPWRNYKNQKIRYTTRYLVDHRYDSLCLAFPKCLRKFRLTGELPLKQPEVNEAVYPFIHLMEHYPDTRNMDHILFYTSLPYRRSPLNPTRRKTFCL